MRKMVDDVIEISDTDEDDVDSSRALRGSNTERILMELRGCSISQIELHIAKAKKSLEKAEYIKKLRILKTLVNSE